MTGPLDDLTVLEVANWVAAPSCGALLADLGAEVTKVEPLGGDGMRGKLRQAAGVDVDLPFQLSNRGKRSIAVDLNDERGRALVQELAGQVDVLLTNLLPDRLARYGLGPDAVRAANPRLVYGLVTGYGSTGADADRIAFDLTAFFGRGGISGLMGEPDGPPPTFRPGQGDHPTGLALLSGVLAALHERHRTGEGQLVETTLLRTAAWTIGCDVSVALVDRQQPARRARTDAMSPMNTAYRCADGRWVLLSAQDQRLWGRFCGAIGRPELADDKRFATPQDRYRNRAEIIGLLDGVFASAPASSWAAALDASGVVWAPAATLPELVDDPQARAVGMWAEVDHPVAGPFETLAAPFTMASSTVAVRGPAPEVGEHTEEVLRRFGVAGGRVAELFAAGVLGGAG